MRKSLILLTLSAIMLCTCTGNKPKENLQEAMSKAHLKQQPKTQTMNKSSQHRSQFNIRHLYS